ncbi:MAG: hypothetical protein KAJ10_03475, partial [Thermodesulfovibrionia bacterium]|nr:hypothetical protein [Thermodesulfovibrionia bacterium]
MKILSYKNKYYLSGFDWVMCVMDDIIKETTCAGNYAQVVFLLNSRVEEELIRSKLARFMKEFPVLQARLSRDYNLAPYWKFPKRQN